jgi:hypothetical protein
MGQAKRRTNEIKKWVESLSSEERIIAERADKILNRVLKGRRMKIVSGPHKPLGQLETVFAKLKAKMLRAEINEPLRLAGLAREQLSSTPVHRERQYVHCAGTTHKMFSEEYMRRLFRNVLAANR